ncbi:MAG: hypothetical protein COZ34_03030 [Candidatus Pacebacteria bacterium CG_4_10_14_3_um_filter_34_15]|nr:hypothetical protein [Candidatus Paceibacterota bacterium]NCS86978.1 hypothetical protein [Candidatus Paceibacterota bacterium]OIO44540.1 MAG: hypothetical protein AUJ41_02760 [Candidatus Pacebacteria bacterium CG1_02_43_31]PIQ80819.1 MAG: hypothetical protein COV78_03535 [Candidatus Pacebacteria bacterium CG11_big_fil_rev_8_21_14_0_20_34_55]PIX81487.1 MAG: hypothetical protein COZ34_03030 [Candidatus Pacebacteria bacterium CG_4_10_14_3_um_filter_34_15]
MLVVGGEKEKRQEEILARGQLCQQIAEVAWSKLNQQYQFPEQNRNSVISRKVILISPQPEKGEVLLITQEYESLSDKNVLHRLAIRLIINSQINFQVVAFAITFDIDEQGIFKGLNTSLSTPQIYLETKKLENLLKAVNDWSTESTN